MSSSLGLPRASPRRHQWSEERTPMSPFEDNIFPSTQRNNLYGMIEGQRTAERVRSSPLPPLTNFLSLQGKKVQPTSAARGSFNSQEGVLCNSGQLTLGRTNRGAGKRIVPGNVALPEAGSKTGIGSSRLPFGRGLYRRHSITGAGVDSGTRGVVPDSTSPAPRLVGAGRGRLENGGRSGGLRRLESPSLSYLCEEILMKDMNEAGLGSNRGRGDVGPFRRGGSPPLPPVRRASWSICEDHGPHAGFEVLQVE
eukprot:TRINITY_DN1506_c0_g2_i1.p1 TRINITY_DN1506_c0_g2~~TRINITY_DN1506_c0_g2_i1.p1  ORF type:complete len:279 (-),score=27.27 TRINITY_DN1506_c0_g2_i1:172-930(-)